MSESKPKGPLTGVRILDLSTMIAGPWSSTLLADLGAEVLKVEQPGVGDPSRGAPPYKDGVPLWSKVLNRNKRGITLDLRQSEGKELLGRLLPEHDVLVENFRPGTLDGWGVTRTWMHSINPGLTILRMTGYGQTGPYRNRSGFARILEAMSGFTNLCGEADGTPMHLGFPIADAVGGLFGAIGVLGALYHRKGAADMPGQEIDCSLFDGMFRLLDFLPIEFDQLGVVRQRSGNRSQYAVPSNVYRTHDGKWVSIAASQQSIYERFCRALGRTDLLSDPRFATNRSRVENGEEMERIISAQIAAQPLDELRAALDEHDVGFSPIHDIAGVFADPHVASREAIISVSDEQLGPVKMQAVVPRYSHTPGGVWRAGPALGQHNEEVFSALGVSSEELTVLKSKKAI